MTGVQTCALPIWGPSGCRRRLTLTQLIAEASKSWHGVRLGHADWGDDSHSIAFTAELRDEGVLVHLILNAYWEPLEFELHLKREDKPLVWRRWIDTALESPDDIMPWQSATPIATGTYRADGRSVAVLIADLAPKSSAPVTDRPADRAGVNRSGIDRAARNKGGRDRH